MEGKSESAKAKAGSVNRGGKRRTANLRRSRKTILRGLAPGDQVTAAWDDDKRQWQLEVDSTNGLEIHHEKRDDSAQGQIGA